MAYDRAKYVEATKTQLEPNIFKHSLAVEACMGALYDYFQSQGQLDDKEPPKDDWLLAGLIHDIDYTEEYKDVHPTKTKEALAKNGLELPESVDIIVKSHAPQRIGVQPVTKAQWSIFCVDSLTGLITAVALIYPSKTLAEVKLSSVMKRFLKQPNFAAGTRRDEVVMCEKSVGLGLPLEKFIDINLGAMKSIATELGL